jgi:predicted DNA-binding ribbon-helix-helix protein
MCRIFAALPPETFASETRSVRLGGHATSIRLEAAFWATLEEIAATQGVSLPKFLTKLHDEVLDAGGQDHNFASLLRCACLTYVTQVKGRAEAERALRASAELDFARPAPAIAAIGPSR